jgi:hypothetical protein
MRLLVLISAVFISGCSTVHLKERKDGIKGAEVVMRSSDEEVALNIARSYCGGAFFVERSERVVTEDKNPSYWDSGRSLYVFNQNYVLELPFICMTSK